MSSPPPPPGAVRPQWQPPLHQPLPPALAPNGQPLASFGDRFLAYLIDYVIYFGVSLIWTIPFMIWWLGRVSEFMNDLANQDMNTDTQPPPPDFSMFLDLYLPMIYFALATTVLAAAFTYVYWVEIQRSRGGQTVGKRVMNIRVIPADPALAELGRGGYVARWAMQWLVGMVVPLFSLLDGLWQLWDKPLQQCLHDKAAKSVVVKVG